MKKLEDYVRSIPDFPEPGIIFRDVTSVLQEADGLQLSINGIMDKLKDVDFDVVVGPESRGFIFGVPVAYNMKKAFVPVRKKGKLPCETVSMEYDLEYGSAVIEMHKHSIKPGQKVVRLRPLPSLLSSLEARLLRLCSLWSLQDLTDVRSLQNMTLSQLSATKESNILFIDIGHRCHIQRCPIFFIKYLHFYVNKSIMKK